MNLHRVFVLAGSAITPLLCSAQACLPAYYGAQVPQGATACLQPTGGMPYGPVPPALYFTGLGGGCDVNGGTLITFYNEDYSDAQKYYHRSFGWFLTPLVSGGVMAYVDWSSNYLANPWDPGFYEGGDSVLSVQVNGNAAGASNFRIAGINPSRQLITSAMQDYGPPWYFGRTLSRESSNQQFNGSKYAYTLSTAHRTDSA